MSERGWFRNIFSKRGAAKKPEASQPEQTPKPKIRREDAQVNGIEPEDFRNREDIRVLLETLESEGIQSRQVLSDLGLNTSNEGSISTNSPTVLELARLYWQSRGKRIVDITLRPGLKYEEIFLDIIKQLEPGEIKPFEPNNVGGDFIGRVQRFPYKLIVRVDDSLGPEANLKRVDNYFRSEVQAGNTSIVFFLRDSAKLEGFNQQTFDSPGRNTTFHFKKVKN